MFEGQRSTKEGDVRVTTALNRMLGLSGAWVRDVAFGQEAVIVTVVLRAKKPVCSGCGARGLKIKEHREKRWRALDLGGLRCVIECRRGAVELVQARRRTAERGALERQRIARDLHDSVSQTLFSMTLHARAAQRAIAGARGVSDGGRHELGQVVDLSSSALAEMRSLIFELRPEGLADEGLVAAIRKHAAVLCGREGIRIEVHGPADRLPLTAGAEENLYRIVQEALANVIKHAQAGNASVTITTTGSEVSIEIADDGRGFGPPASSAGHMGLQSINDRARELGGTATIHNGTGGGTRVVVVVPAVAPEVSDDV
jgi:signal transduction histidine kinase